MPQTQKVFPSFMSPPPPPPMSTSLLVTTKVVSFFKVIPCYLCYAKPLFSRVCLSRPEEGISNPSPSSLLQLACFQLEKHSDRQPSQATQASESRVLGGALPFPPLKASEFIQNRGCAVQHKIWSGLRSGRKIISKGKFSDLKW